MLFLNLLFFVLNVIILIVNLEIRKGDFHEEHYDDD